MRQTRLRTQAGLKPCKDDNEVWHESDRKDMKWFCLIVVIDLIKQWGEAIASPLFFVLYRITLLFCSSFNIASKLS